MKDLRRTDTAVSPVIGVILMLTLTLIIAAVASTFAGGLMETKLKPPSVTLQAEYSHNEGFLIRHFSGDPLPVSELSLILTPSLTFGPGAEKHSRPLDSSLIQNNAGEKWGSGVTFMQVGDVHRIPVEELDVLDNGENDSSFWFNQTSAEGKTFYLEIYYDRNLIAKPEVMIRN